jgi:hypothetical protein
MEPAQFRKMNLNTTFGASLPTEGAMWLLFTSNITNPQTPQVNFFSRVRYIDN